MNTPQTAQLVKEAEEKVAIGPRTLGLLTRPSAMRQLDEKAIEGVTKGMSKWFNKMKPGEAARKLRAGKGRVAGLPQRSAAHTVAEKAKFEDSAGQKLMRAITGDKQRPAVPSMFRGTEAAESGRKWRQAEAAALKSRKGPSTLSKATDKVKGLANEIKPQGKAQPVRLPTPAMA